MRATKQKNYRTRRNRRYRRAHRAGRRRRRRVLSGGDSADWRRATAACDRRLRDGFYRRCCGARLLRQASFCEITAKDKQRAQIPTKKKASANAAHPETAVFVDSSSSCGPFSFMSVSRFE